MKNYRKIICLLLILVMLTALSGCGGKKSKEFQVMFCGPYVSQELVDDYVGTLDLPPDSPIHFNAFSFGSEQVDAAAYGASAMAMTAMLFAGDVDIMVCTLDEAARYGRSGAFWDLTEVFTPEQLEAASDRLIRFDQVDEQGAPTGGQTAPCGIDLSENQNLSWILGGEKCGVFITGYADPELAGEIFRMILR